MRILDEIQVSIDEPGGSSQMSRFRFLNRGKRCRGRSTDEFILPPHLLPPPSFPAIYLRFIIRSYNSRSELLDPDLVYRIFSPVFLLQLFFSLPLLILRIASSRAIVFRQNRLFDVILLPLSI